MHGKLGITGSSPMKFRSRGRVPIDHSEKMADVHFIRMHCDRKSFKKANGRLLKDRHKAGG